MHHEDGAVYLSFRAPTSHGHVPFFVRPAFYASSYVWGIVGSWWKAEREVRGSRLVFLTPSDGVLAWGLDSGATA